jgi:hypothetical protein
MRNLFTIAAITAAFATPALSFGEPARMNDHELSSVVAGHDGTSAGSAPSSATVHVENNANASNVVRTDSGSASATCKIGCAAVNAPILSGNIVGPVSQSSTATVSTR